MAQRNSAPQSPDWLLGRPRRVEGFGRGGGTEAAGRADFLDVNRRLAAGGFLHLSIGPAVGYSLPLTAIEADTSGEAIAALRRLSSNQVNLGHGSPRPGDRLSLNAGWIEVPHDGGGSSSGRIGHIAGMSNESGISSGGAPMTMAISRWSAISIVAGSPSKGSPST